MQPAFWLDAIVPLKTNEGKSWGISIYSYIEDCWHTLLLIAHIGHAHWLSDLQWGRVDAGSTFDLVRGDLAVGYVVASVLIEVRALWCR